MSGSLRIAIAGASGKMGQMLIAAVASDSDTKLAAALDRADSPLIGRDAGQAMGLQLNVPVTSDLSALAGADVLIDFTRPEASLLHLKACLQSKTRVVLVTTVLMRPDSPPLMTSPRKHRSSLLPI